MKTPALLLTLLMILASTAHAADTGPFTLTSPDIKDGGTIDDRFVFDGFGCTGKNTPPALSWENAPAGTQSFAVTVYDPDAPTGSGWWHWVVYNIPGGSNGIAGGNPGGGATLPKDARQGLTDYGTAQYGGPCPPKGDAPHHYIVTVYALDVLKLDVPDKASAAMIGFNINAHKIGEAKLTATYGR